MDRRKTRALWAYAEPIYSRLLVRKKEKLPDIGYIRELDTA